MMFLSKTSQNKGWENGFALKVLLCGQATINDKL